MFLVVSVSLDNAREVRTAVRKWQTFALTPYSVSAGSNSDFQDRALLTKLKASREAQFSIGAQYVSLMPTALTRRGKSSL